MIDAASPVGAAGRPPASRRLAGLLALLLLAAVILAACKDVQPGSGVEGINRSRTLSSVSGK